MTLQLCIARLDQGRVHHGDERAGEIFSEEFSDGGDDDLERGERRELQQAQRLDQGLIGDLPRFEREIHHVEQHGVELVHVLDQGRTECPDERCQT